MPHRTTRVLAVRHGETAWNVDARMQGHLDIPLNEHGRWQAGRAAAALAEEQPVAIYASDLSRAYDTAVAIAAPHGLTVQIDAGLRERGFGKFEGCGYLEIDERWPAESDLWRRRDPDYTPAGGESLRVFSDRCVGTATRLAEAHPDETIILVAHGGVMDCLYRAASRIELQAPRSWQLGNASINRLLFSQAGFTLVGWNDSFHLEPQTLDEAADGALPAARG